MTYTEQETPRWKALRRAVQHNQLMNAVISYGWELQGKPAADRMRAVVTTQQALSAQDNPETRAYARAAYEAYTDPFGAKTYA